MPASLPVSRLINIIVNLSPVPPPSFNFDSLLILGDSDVINVSERIRSYSSLTEVSGDFGTTAPEYLAADLFFSQLPSPAQLYIGRWAKTPTHGMLIGGPLTAAEQAMALWTVITNGTFSLHVNGGGLANITGCNFSGQTNLNGVASQIQTQLGGTATCIWNGEQFIFTSPLTGASSSVSFLVPEGTGTDISTMLLCTASTYQSQVQGIAAESALTAVSILDSLQYQWYALSFAAGNNNADLTDNDYLQVASFIEASGVSGGNPHIFGVTTNEAAALITTDSTSVGYVFHLNGFNRSLVQFCSTSAYAICSFFGRAFTVDFNVVNSTITMMYKQEPGVVPEQLGTSQADALDKNNYNYFVGFNNNTAIIVNGKVASGQFFDTIWGIDWLANQIQNNIFSLLFTFPKVPQTDAGMHLLVNASEVACVAGVNNGLIAPGVWTGPGFGVIKTGDLLPKGFYVFAPAVATQSESDRAARRSVPLQAAIKLAGAVHSVQMTVNVNQ